MSCDVGEVTERLENEQSSFSNLSVTSPTSQLILQPFRRFTYVTSSSLNSPGEPAMLKSQLINISVTIIACMGKLINIVTI